MALELPFTAMMDTTVFLCRLGEKPDHPDASVCIDFCDRMVRAHRHLLVSAPTIAEVTRGRGVPVPRVPGIVVVAFDERAATLLGTKLPARTLKELRAAASDGRSLDHIKYDAMIVGCAMRVPVCTFVSMDGGQLDLAARCGLAAHHPRDFYADAAAVKPIPLHQGSLPLPLGE